jgi:hypothetical protein
LRDGDIVLRAGGSAYSDMIKAFLADGSGISHCAIVTLVSEGNYRELSRSRVSFKNGGGAPRLGRPAAIHSINATLSGVDGVQIEDLEDFNRYSMPATIVVVRPKTSDAQRDAFMHEARRLLAAATPFDNKFDLSTKSDAYCSELVYRSFAASGWMGLELWDKKMGVLRFSSLLDRRDFDIVISHNPRVPY